MTDERKRRRYQLFDQALELPQHERTAFLDQACGGDAALRQEVEALLEQEARTTAGGILNTPALEKFAGILEQSMEAKAMSDRPLLLNDRYLIPNPSQPMGEGGFGKVYLAYDQRLHDRRVIVKTLKPALDPQINQYIHDKFHGDIDALTRFRHPHIVNILDKGALPDNGEPFFVMDLIEGESLRDAMKRERLDSARIARIIRQVGHAITYAHELGVYHRDLKPENLMLRAADDSVVVIDFGIATVQEWKREQRRGDPPKKTMLVGTAEYMAPEQIRGVPEAASDTWALDVISFELLTGQLPFAVPRDAQTGQVQWPTLLNELQSGVRVRPSALRPQLPAAAESVLLQSLAYRAQDRHAETRVFGDALAAALLQSQPALPTQPLTEIIAGPTIADTEPLEGSVTAPAPPTQLNPSLQSLLALATPTNRIQPKLAGEARQARGMGAKPGSAPRRFRQGDRLRLTFDSDWEGHLLLLDEGPEGIVYCLCPSQFAPDTRLRRGVVELPQPGAPDNAFEITGEVYGREHLLAIVSDEPLGLDWLSRDSQRPARELSQENLDTLLNRLRVLDAGRWQALTTHFEIVA